MNSFSALTPLSVTKGGSGLVSVPLNRFLTGNLTGSFNSNIAVPTGPVVGTTDIQTLSNKTILHDNIVLASQKVGNTLFVDKIYGNDLTASAGGLPYLTLSAALAAVTAGTFSESNLIIPNNVTVRGSDAVSTVISAINVTSSTTIFTMGDSCRLEDVNIVLTSSTPNITLIGIVFPGTTTVNSQLRTLRVNITNTTTIGATVYGILSNGIGRPDTKSNSIRGTTISVSTPNAEFGVSRSIFINGPNGITARDTNFTAIGSNGTSNVGLEVSATGSYFTLTSGSVRGGNFDYLETQGSISLSGVDTTGNISFTNNITGVSAYFKNSIITDLGKVSNITGNTGTINHLNISTLSLSNINPTTGTVPYYNSSSNLVWNPNYSYINIRDEKPVGTNGGTFTSGEWVTRSLNTLDSNIPEVSLTSNQITLPSGKYKITASAPVNAVQLNQLKLYNITDSTDILFGQISDVSSTIQVSALLSGCFIINGTKILELQHKCQTTRLTTGLGEAAGFGPEIYSIVDIVKIY